MHERVKHSFLEKCCDETIRLKRYDYFIQVQGQIYVASDLDIKGIHAVLYFEGEMPPI